MRALLYGVEAGGPRGGSPAGGNPLLEGLARAPARLVELPDPGVLRPDWVVLRPRLTGICGSDSKTVLGDYGKLRVPGNPLQSFVSRPHVLGHEVVADVVEVGPEAGRVAVGDRVVLDPWLTCAPRGVDPPCPACVAGDHSLCWSFTAGAFGPGTHVGTCADVTGGFADLLPAHDSMCHRVPEVLADELAVLADPFAVSLHAVTRHPPPPAGRALVYGAGALGTCATAVLRALHPDVDVMVVARFDVQAEMARRLGAAVVRHEPAAAVVEEVARWSGGVLHPAGPGLPMAHPGGVDVVYDTVGDRETLEVGVRVLRARGTMVYAGVHGPDLWEWSPLYFKEISWVGSNAFGWEEVDGVRRHGIDHYLDLAASGRVDLTGMLTHTFPLDRWRDAFAALAAQDESRALKVAFDFRDRGRVAP